MSASTAKADRKALLDNMLEMLAEHQRNIAILANSVALAHTRLEALEAAAKKNPLWVPN